jgi:hypothetical protein
MSRSAKSARCMTRCALTSTVTPIACRDRAARPVGKAHSIHQDEIAVDRLTLTPAAATPIGWRIGNIIHLIGVPLVLLLLAPLLLIYAPIFALQLRRREKHDPEVIPRPEPSHVQALAEIEDHDVTNQFSALGSVKPGLFRRWTVTFLVWLLDYGARHIYHRGYLTRVNTIHFARWVFLDDKSAILR